MSRSRSAALFEAPTVEALAQRLHEGEAARPALVLAQPRPAEIPLSFAQRRLWFLRSPGGAERDLQHPDGGAASRARSIGGAGGGAGRCGGASREPAHDIPRDTLGVTAARDPAKRRTARPRLYGGARSSEAALAGMLSEAARRGFDLASEPPLRAHLFCSARRACAAAAAAPHAGDGWSLAPLWRDVAAAYAARLEGKAPAFAALPVQYADYTLWQHRCWARERSGQRDGAAAGVLDRDAQGPSRSDRAAERPAAACGVELSRRQRPAAHRCRAAPRSAGAGARRRASLFMVLQAGLAALLTRLGAGNDIPIGSPIAGRTGQRGLDDLVGFFVNTLVLRTDTSGNPLACELIDGAGQPIAAYAHQDLVRAVGGGAQPRALAVAASAVPGDAGVAEQCAGELRAAGAERQRSSRSPPAAPSSTCLVQPWRATRGGRLACRDRRRHRIRHGFV